MRINIPFNYNFIKELDLGLTNKNYLITIDNQDYICRLPLNDLKIFNRNNEKNILDLVSKQDFALDVFYYHEGIQISKYQKDLINYQDYKQKDKVLEVAKLMKKLHALPTNNIESFDPIAMIDTYANHIKKMDIKLSDFDYLFKQYKEHKFKAVICHNDWVDGNICFINHKSYLIDYEYAGLNDPLFDIMSFITENDLSKKEKHDFLYAMLPKIDDSTMEALKMYRDLNNLLWYLWSQMMYEARNESIYLDIKAIKNQQLFSQLGKPLDFL